MIPKEVQIYLITMKEEQPADELSEIADRLMDACYRNNFESAMFKK